MTLIAFFAIDFVGLKILMYPLFQRHIGEILRAEVQVAVAGSFYCLYVVGLMYFAVLPAVRAENLGLDSATARCSARRLRHLRVLEHGHAQGLGLADGCHRHAVGHGADRHERRDRLSRRARADVADRGPGRPAPRSCLAHIGSSTRSSTWITPFDWLTSEMVIVALLPDLSPM
ncbi:MAG: DUF2177 family protein [Rhodobacteraceae bacterium]|nr:DUF2177 family protein [Paracoccaceae bacterium]